MPPRNRPRSRRAVPPPDPGPSLPIPVQTPIPPRNRPHSRRAVPPPDPGPSLPSPASTLLPADLQARTQENFDLDNVAGSDDSDSDDSDSGNSDSDCGDVVRDLGINDPDAIRPSRRKKALDTLYFYTKIGDLKICNMCQ